MKKFAIRTPKPKPNGTLSEIVAECVAIEQERKARDTLAAWKLSAAAFLREAIRIADTQPERLRELREKIYDPENPMWFEAKAALRRMVVSFRSPNWAGPSRELRRYNFLLTGETLSEVVALGSSTFELAALAVLITTEEHPDAFGKCEDLVAHEKKLMALALRRDELYQQIETQYTADDLLIGKPDAKGNAVVSFKISNGAVTLGPNAGERLVSWKLAQDTNP
jgi:hypothetical protein